MAEIKSTLDLIMERTKNLTMTDEEKKDLQLKELQSKVKGYLQRFMDGHIDATTMEEELFENHGNQQALREMIRKEALNHIAPTGNNERILRLLHDLLGSDTQPISCQIDTFLQERQHQMAEHAKRGLQILGAQGIRGSAVMPNLEKDPVWQIWLAEFEASFRKTLSAIDIETNTP